MIYSTLLQHLTEQDGTWANYAEDQLKHQERDIRNLLIAARTLRYLRQHNLSREWLATKMDVELPVVVEMLKGRGAMTLRVISQLENVTGLSFG